MTVGIRDAKRSGLFDTEKLRFAGEPEPAREIQKIDLSSGWSEKHHPTNQEDLAAIDRVYSEGWAYLKLEPGRIIEAPQNYQITELGIDDLKIFKE